MKISKREFCKGLLAVSVTAAIGGTAFAKPHTPNNLQEKEDIMAFTLPELPYAKDALAPHISANTLDFHHGKHHAAYVNKLNELVQADAAYQGLSLEEVIKKSDSEKKAPIFNNSAQVWNHTFYWNSMKKGGGGAPKGKIGDKITADFGSFDKFKEEFKNAGATQFGSGWAWLVLDGGKLKVTKTPNADLPMVHGQTALLTMDVWEHAYYLDYQNKRPDYMTVFLDNLVNWDYVEQNLAKA